MRSRSTRNRRLVTGAVALVAALALGACGGGGDDDEEAGGSEATSTTREPVTTTTGAPVIAPLTGLVDPTGTSTQRGPLWVKVDNNKQTARPPQAGLEVADVVFEEPIESATRFLALFHSTLPERIGPVRSTRFLDAGIVWHVGGTYVYSGGTPPKVEAIRNSPVQTVDENGMQTSDARERDPNFRAPHNLFLHPANLLAWAEVENRTPPEPMFTFLADGATFAGEPAGVVEIPTFSEARYTWDAASGGWKREAQLYDRRGIEPHVAESGQQLAPTNLIIQMIPRIRDNTDDRTLVTGDGDAWVCSQGRCVQGRWSRPDLDANTTFSDAGGEEVALTPGTTWVHFITSGAPTISP